MTKADCLLVMLPLSDDAQPRFWLIADGAVVGEGCLPDLPINLDVEQLADVPVIAVVPATRSSFYAVEAKGLEPRQELAVARVDAQQAALGTAHIATVFAADGKVIVAAADSATIEQGVDRLAELGLWVKAVVPAAALVSPPDGELWKVDLGGEVFLRAADRASPDEAALRMALFGSAQPTVVDGDQLAASMIAFSRDPVPDFLDGRARKRHGGVVLNNAHRLWLKRLALLAVLLVLVSGLAHWAKLQWAISQEQQKALSAAQKIDPAITDIAQVNARVDAALARKGTSQSKAGMLVAIVWQSAQSVENVSVNDLRVSNNGLLTATLAAPDANGINAALLAIQRAGYEITATPRRDPSGLTLVDLTVKMP